MEYLIWLVIGLCIGVFIAILSKNEKTADSVRMFTEEDYLENRYNDLRRRLRWKKNALKSKLRAKLPFLFTLVLCFGVITVPVKTEAADMRSVICEHVSCYNEIPEQCAWITDAILYASSVYQVDPYLIAATMQVESGYNFDIYSPVGAIGLMQLMPGTAAALGVDPYNPLENILGGANCLRIQLDAFADSGKYAVTNAVAAYNAGGAAVREYGGVPPYRETFDYVFAINDAYNHLINLAHYE